MDYISKVSFLNQIIIMNTIKLAFEENLNYKKYNDKKCKS